MHFLAASLHHVYWHVPITYSDAGTGRGGGQGGGGPQYFGDQLTLFQLGDDNLSPTITAIFWLQVFITCIATSPSLKVMPELGQGGGQDLPLQIFADQLTLFQPGKGRLSPNLHHHVCWHVPITYSDAAGTGGKGGPLNYFVDQLTLLQPGEGRLFPTITMYWPPKLCHLPASLSLINSSLFLIFRNDILGLYFGMI